MGDSTPLLQTLKELEKAAEGFHTKGYIFKKEEIYRIIIGSSNMTSAALTSNREWNTKVVSTEQGEVANLRKILEKGEDRALLISATGERGIFVTGGRNPGFTRVSEV